MGGMEADERIYRVARAASPGIAFGLGIVLMGVRQLALAQFCWVLIPLQLALYRRFLRPRIDTAPAAEAPQGKPS